YQPAWRLDKAWETVSRLWTLSARECWMRPLRETWEEKHGILLKVVPIRCLPSASRYFLFLLYVLQNLTAVLTKLLFCLPCVLLWEEPCLLYGYLGKVGTFLVK